MESIKKLDQIVQVSILDAMVVSCEDDIRHQAVLTTPQNFHTKAAVLVLASRIGVRPVRNKDGQVKPNKWVSYPTVCLAGNARLLSCTVPNRHGRNRRF